MSTIVYQNLIVSSSFESQLAETTTTLKLKVAPPPLPPPPPPPPSEFCEKLATDTDHPTNLEFGNWDFLQTSPKESEDYTDTNPWTEKSSFSSLSPKSLELCTENLGSETGSDGITDGAAAAIFSSPSPPLISPSEYSSTSHFSKAEIDTNCKQEVDPPKYPNRKDASNCRETKNFPPPLTTMSGASSLQVLRHREGGRLIIEAVEAPYMNSYMQAERSDGRLRLCFLTSDETTSAAAASGEEEDDDEWGGETAAEEEEEIEVGSELKEEIDQFDGEINNLEKEFHWVISRCKDVEGGGHGRNYNNKGLCSYWKPALWVAI